MKDQHRRRAVPTSVESHKAGEQHRAAAERRTGPAAPGGTLPLSSSRIIMPDRAGSRRRAPTWSRRGDADLSIDLQPRDTDTADPSRSRVKAKLVSMPQTNGFTHVIACNTQGGAVRQSRRCARPIAAALSYDSTCSRRRSVRARRASSTTEPGRTTPPDASFPQPMPVQAAIVAPGQGSCSPRPASRTASTTFFAFNVGCGADGRAGGGAAQGVPRRKVGIQVEIQKKPDARDLNTLVVGAQDAVLHRDGATAWLPYDLLLLPHLYFYARAALELSPPSGATNAWRSSTRRCALPDRQGQVRRRPA